jgi:hypothetical protein
MPTRRSRRRYGGTRSPIRTNKIGWRRSGSEKLALENDEVVMAQFYISNDEPKDVQRCKESCAERVPITITGLTMENRVGVFTGVVQGIENDEKRPQGRRWRVTIRQEA